MADSIGRWAARGTGLPLDHCETALAAPRKLMATARRALPFEMPDSATVLLILDMISDFDFPDGPAVLRGARRIAPRIAALKARCHRAKVPVIYVNDSIGRWRSDLGALLQHCQSRSRVVHDVVQQIIPEPNDFFVLKPRHSGFFATPLAALLEQARAQTIILTGVTADQCVLFTANDAHLRALKLVIPGDCVASATPAKARFALKYFTSVLGADVRPAARLLLQRKRRSARSR